MLKRFKYERFLSNIERAAIKSPPTQLQLISGLDSLIQKLHTDIFYIFTIQDVFKGLALKATPSEYMDQDIFV